jgi:hypothetical protein
MRARRQVGVYRQINPQKCLTGSAGQEREDSPPPVAVFAIALGNGQLAVQARPPFAHEGIPADGGEPFGHVVVERRGHMEQSAVALVGVGVFAIDSGQQRTVGEAREYDGQQVRLGGQPRGEAFPESWMAKGPSRPAKRRTGYLEETAGEGVQSPDGTGGGAAGPVDDVALCLGKRQRVFQAAVDGSRVDEGERRLLVGAELLVDIPQELVGMGHELGDAALRQRERTGEGAKS